MAFSQEDLENGEEVATCPSCSLIIKVIYDKVSYLLNNTQNDQSSTACFDKRNLHVFWKLLSICMMISDITTSLFLSHYHCGFSETYQQQFGEVIQ